MSDEHKTTRLAMWEQAEKDTILAHPQLSEFGDPVTWYAATEQKQVDVMHMMTLVDEGYMSVLGESAELKNKLTSISDDLRLTVDGKNQAERDAQLRQAQENDDNYQQVSAEVDAKSSELAIFRADVKNFDRLYEVLKQNQKFATAMLESGRVYESWRRND